MFASVLIFGHQNTVILPFPETLQCACVSMLSVSPVRDSTLPPPQVAHEARRGATVADHNADTETHARTHPRHMF